MRLCTLCGIPITQRLHEDWLQEFRAVWTEDDGWNSIKLSGVGTGGENDGAPEGTVPIDPSARHDDLTEPEQINVGLVRFTLEEFVCPERLRFEPEPFWGWAFHLSCWNIFTVGFTPNLGLLFEVCLSLPIGQDTLLDWGHEYGGAAMRQLKWETTTLTPHFYRQSYIPQSSRSDPFHIATITRAISNAVHLREDMYGSQIKRENLNLEGDGFTCLPPEILHSIIVLLPSRDVCALRQASPVFATLSLSEMFWESRFQPGHEFDFIFEVLDTHPRSWRALYLSFQTWGPDNSSLANRRRIWTLAKQLQGTLGQMEEVSCSGAPLRTWFEFSAPDGESQPHNRSEPIAWIQAAYCVTPPETSFKKGSRVLRARSLYFLQPLEIQSMSVSFISTPGGTFVSGLLFVGKDGQHHPLGYLHHNHSIQIQVPNDQGIQGWQLAFDEPGIKAISIVFHDGTVSPWAGDASKFSRWHLAEASAISAIKAEFDALKLVTLSRDTSIRPRRAEWRNSCIWYPDIPSEHMMFDWAKGNKPPSVFNIPIRTLVFGGPGKEDISDLIKIVIWTFDISQIAGIELLHTDSSKNQHLGHIGPFPDYPRARRFGSESEDHRIVLSIDSAKDEKVSSIETRSTGSSLVGVKIHTSFGREVTTPESPYDRDKEWITIHPTGSKVVGLFATHGDFLFDLGLISTI